MNPIKRLVFFILFIAAFFSAHAQAPNISYPGPKTFTTGVPIPAILPVNTGGAVPATVFGQVSTFAGQAGVQGKANGNANQATFSYLGAIAIDATGNMYVADYWNNLIRKITPGGVVSTLAGSGDYGANNGPGSQATFYNISGITVDPSGNVYVAEQGNELIRKITPAGIVSTFAGKTRTAGFKNGQDTSATFAEPLGLASDKQGNIYVCDYDNRLIRKITPSGLVSTFAGQPGVGGDKNGSLDSATFEPFALAFDAAGNMYVGQLDHIIRKITTGGQVSTFAGSGNVGSADGTGTAASFYQPVAMVADGAGNLYVADGANSNVRKISPAGVVTTIAGTAGVNGANDGIGAAASFVGPYGLAFDTAGNLYVSDYGNFTIRKIIVTGYAIDKALPNGLAFDGTTGKISGRPNVFSPSTTYNITGYNLTGSSSATINLTVNGELNFPPMQPVVYGTANFSPATSTAGSITYNSSNPAVASVVAGKIHTLSVGTSTITATRDSTILTQLLTVVPAPLTVVADNKSKAFGSANPALTITYGGFVNGDDATKLTATPVASTSATLSSLPGLYPINVAGAADSNYTISYVAGSLAILGGKTSLAPPQISYPHQEVYTNGTAITPLLPANSGGAVPATVYGQVSAVAGELGVTGSTNGNGTAATFNQPSGIAVDKNGNLYVTDQVANLIRKITPAGDVTTFAGSGLSGFQNGIGTSATFEFPTGIAVDTLGNLYVVDQGSGFIRKITPGAVVSTFAGGGPQLDGQGTMASFSLPRSIAIDQSGNLYVADTYNFLIRKITPSGLVSTIAGIKGVQGSANGPGLSATFSGPSGIAVDAMGNIYVADDWLIRKITPDGTVSTLAGTGASGSNDGIGTAASFGLPQYLAVDAAGNLYVSDEGNNLIRKITPAGVVSTIVGTNGSYGSYNGIGTAATINFPVGITLDQSGNAYFVDYGNKLIRKFPLTGYSINKALPAGLNFDATTGIISGKPAVVSPAADYTITGNNISGGSTSVINLTVNPSSNANLNALSINFGTLSPAFSPGTTSYTASVSSSIDSLYVIPIPADSTATVTINGAPKFSSTTFGPILLSPGVNTIPVVVTAQDGVTTKTYTIKITRGTLSTNALLASISTLPAVTLVGATGPGYLNFTATVPAATTSIQVVPTAKDATATITVNGQPVASGTASQSIVLPIGQTVITTVLTAQDGVTTKTVIITVTRTGSANDNLSSLAISNGSLSPAFTSATTSYTASVATAVSAIAVTPVASDSTATIMVNGVPVASGTTVAGIPLNVGVNTITTVVTAQNGTSTKTYTIKVTRAAASTNALIASISTLPVVTLVGATGPGYLNFTATVPNSTTSIQVVPTAKDATATITVNGQAVASGTASQSIALPAGQTVITTVLTAQDGVTTKTVIITVTRPPSTNAGLSNIALSTGTLTPAFASNTTGYAASVSNATASVKITPTASDSTASITVNGTAIKSGAASAAIPLVVGTNTITTVVTAQDGKTTKTYTTTVTRVSNNALLATISTLPVATLVGATGPGYLNFTAAVPGTVTSIQVVPTAKDATATITVNGQPVASGTPSQAIALPSGPTVITTVITAQDGVTTKTIIITVNRAVSTNAGLAKLALSSGTLSPAFATATTSYTASVANTVASVTVTPTTSDPTAKVTVNGTSVASGAASQAITLNLGSNTITTVVTAQDGKTTKTYSVTVNRVPSNNALLASIATLPATSLLTTTGTGYLNFTTTVPNSISSLQVKPTAKDTTATITVNGQAVASGTPSQSIALTVGATLITTIITAQDGITTKTVTITVNRAAPPSHNSFYQPQTSVTKPNDQVSLADDGITVHEAVSPNGDGINDYLAIDGITGHPENKLTIIDRNGQLVYQTTGYDNSSKVFDGHSNGGKMQLPGTYFYSLDYIVNGESRHKTGYILLKY